MKVSMKKVLICVFVFCFALICIGATKYSKIYEDATQLMVDGDYAGAASLFDSIASYEDSSKLAMYCKANSLAEQGKYDEAIDAFEFFGDYKDCEYLVVYYSACQLEELAADDPLMYLDAADEFQSISLFRDCSERADRCRQNLYDIADDQLDQGNFYDAYDYFHELGDFSDSGERVKECFYLYGLKTVEEKDFETAVWAFAGAEDYLDAEQYAQKVQTIAHLLLKPENRLFDGNSNIILEYSDHSFYAGDAEGDFFNDYALCIENVGEATLKFKVTCVIDGETYSWNEDELETERTAQCSISILKAPDHFTEGAHSCTWYIDGIEVITDSYTVFPGVSEERTQAIETAGSVDTEISVAQYNMNTPKGLSDFSQETQLSVNLLGSGKDFVPVITVTNNTDKTVSVWVSAIIDGKNAAWDRSEIKSSDYNHFFSSSNPLTPGKHKVQAFVNGIETASWEFEIEKENESYYLNAEGNRDLLYTGRVGVSMPTRDLQRWRNDGENIKALLEAIGYEVDLQFGANDIATQVSQIENMIADGCEVLVITAIDGDSLGTVLSEAKKANIPVIAYDRLIMNCDAVSYYTTFDNWQVGVAQGKYIEEALDLKNAVGPFNIEFITGDPGDYNINFFFDGAMSILQPYLDSGVLVCPSGQTEKAVVATANWATDAAQARFENIIRSNYSDGTRLDAVLASNDSTARGVERALESSYTGEWPVITGQDCDIAIMPNLIAGKQSMSVFKDTRTLAAKVVEMVDAIMQGKEPPVNDTETYDNGTGIIPSFLCEPVVCTADNFKELLIGSRYYTPEELNIEIDEDELAEILAGTNIGSGTVRSDTGTGLDIHADWSAVISGKDTADITVKVYADCYSLYTTATPDALNIALDGDNVSLPMPAIERDGTDGAGSVVINTHTFTVPLAAGELREIPLDVTLKYQGSYSGVSLDEIECGGTLLLKR